MCYFLYTGVANRKALSRQKLLDNVGSVEGEIAWGSEEAELPIEAVEAVMQAAGRR